jgi:hypothetical protein
VSKANDQGNGGKYRVLVDDNYDYMSPDARWTAGEFDSADAAIAKCKSMVDEDLTNSHEPGMTAAALYTAYTMFGDDPFVVAPLGAEGVTFSAWDYAKQRSAEICRAAASPDPESKESGVGEAG